MALEKEHGMIAILDALGASSYGDEEIAKFLKARKQVLANLDDWLEEKTSIDASDLVIFTFNDTIVIVYRCGEFVPGLQDVTSFAALLRNFLVNALDSGLLFRGSAAIGMFHVDPKSHTVLGEAVTDAAQWYEQSDWMGVHFTPRSYLEMTRMIEVKGDPKRWAFLPYPVPLKDGRTLSTYAINWPKTFLVKRLHPWKDATPPRTKVLEFLSREKVPLGTEAKYYNTLAFFDHSVALENVKNK